LAADLATHFNAHIAQCLAGTRARASRPRSTDAPCLCRPATAGACTPTWPAAWMSCCWGRRRTHR
jgi:hypothetical protein